MNKAIMKKIIGAIGIIALINVAVLSYLHFNPTKNNPSGEVGAVADGTFQEGNWEMKITSGDLIKGPNSSCLTREEIKEFYTEERYLKELAPFCKTDVAQISQGYEITGMCRNKSAEFSMLVKYQKTADNAFTVYRESKSKATELDFTETIEAKRLGDCE